MAKGIVVKFFPGQIKRDGYEIEMSVEAESLTDFEENYRFRFLGGEWEKGIPACHRIEGIFPRPAGFGIDEVDACWEQIAEGVSL